MEAVVPGVRSATSEPSKWMELRQHLRTWREEGTRNSLKAVEGGNLLIAKKKSELGNEVWSVYEQTYMASLDCGDLELAKECLDKLQHQHPGSLRVERLRGLYLEAQEKYDEAEDLYDSVLESHPSCSAVWKRKVAVLKAQNKMQEAIDELSKLLHIYMTDFESWLEITDLYIGMNDYRRASFCMEELILGNPHHYLYHLKYAEIFYTIGSSDKMELSRKHYATALKLNPSSLRALFGFYMVLLWLSGKSKQGENRSKTTYQSLEWVKVQIKKKYQFDDNKLRIVEKMLDRS